MNYSIKPNEHHNHIQLLFGDNEFLGASISRIFSTVKILWYSHTSDVKNSMEWTAVFGSEIAKGKKMEFTGGWSTKEQCWKEIAIEDKDETVLNELKKYGFN